LTKLPLRTTQGVMETAAQEEFTENGLMQRPDVVLIGGGIMSATLGIMLKHLNPNIKIQIVELLSSVALESSHATHQSIQTDLLPSTKRL